jgi:hypothetical protein
MENTMLDLREEERRRSKILCRIFWGLDVHHTDEALEVFREVSSGGASAKETTFVAAGSTQRFDMSMTATCPGGLPAGSICGSTRFLLLFSVSSNPLACSFIAPEIF